MGKAAPLVQVPAHLLDYRGGLAFDQNMRRALAPPPDWLVWQWADERRKLSRKHAKRAGRWRTDVVPFMREPMAFLSARSQVQRIDLMKGAQVSGTETANNWVGYTVELDPTSMLYVSPSLTVTKRTSARIQAMIDEDPEGLGKKILPSRQRDAKNSQFEKHFPNGALYFATAKSAAGLRSTAVERLVLDELEAYPRDVEDEGSTEDVAEARGDTFGDTFKTLAISTPGIDQTSLIKPAHDRGDQRLYMMPCPHCGRLINFRKENLAWDSGKPHTAHYVCQACNRKVEQRHKKTMLPAGIWIPKFLREDPEAMARIEAGDRSQLDEHNATVRRVSYHLPSLYSPLGWLSWAKIAERWEAAEGLPAKMKVIVNTVFGETWVEAGDAPAWESVYARREQGYVMRQVPRDVVFLAAGADPGIDHVVISVWGYGRKRRRFLVDHFRIDGDIHDPETWAQVATARRRLYLHPSGAALPIRMFGVDRNYHPDVVDPWVQEQGDAGVVAVLGRDYLDQFFRWSRRKDKATADTTALTSKARFDYLIVGASYGKLDLYGNLNLRLVEGKERPAGWIALPKDVTPDFCKELVSERLTYDEKKGRRAKGKWVGVGSTRHEALDTAVYPRALASVIGIDRWSDADWEREERRLADAAEAARDLREDKAREFGVPVDEVPWSQVFANLVLPGDRDEEVTMPEEQEEAAPVVRRIDVSAKARAEQVERREIEAAPAPDLLPERKPPEDPADPRYAGVKTGWSRGRKAAPQAGVVGCRADLKGLLAPEARELDHGY